MWQFSSHKSVFFCLLIENLAQTGQLAVTATVPWVRIPPSPFHVVAGDSRSCTTLCTTLVQALVTLRRAVSALSLDGRALGLAQRVTGRSLG